MKVTVVDENMNKTFDLKNAEFHDGKCTLRFFSLEGKETDIIFTKDDEVPLKEYKVTYKYTRDGYFCNGVATEVVSSENGQDAVKKVKEKIGKHFWDLVDVAIL